MMYQLRFGTETRRVHCFNAEDAGRFLAERLREGMAEEGAEVSVQITAHEMSKAEYDALPCWEAPDR